MFYNDERTTVQSKGIEILFYFLQNYGNTFPKDYWKNISEGILIPFIERISSFIHDKRPNDTENKSLINIIFNHLDELVNSNFENLIAIFLFYLEFSIDLINKKKDVNYIIIFNFLY